MRNKLLLLLTAILFIGVNVNAQDKKKDKKEKPKKVNPVDTRTNKTMAAMGLMLELTEEQTPKVRQIIFDRETQKEDMRSMMAMEDWKGMREKMGEIQKASDVKLKEVLTAGQMEKMMQLRKEQREEMRKRFQEAQQSGQMPTMNEEEVQW